MARPREFDRDAALATAITVFWQKGYEATSTEDLLQAMGIGRQSMYGAFGDKRQVYLEALRHYNLGNLTAQATALRSAASPLAALHDLLHAVPARSAAGRRMGCMGINAICEFGSRDPNIAAILNDSSRQLHALLERTLAEAKAKGEVRADLDEAKAARFLHATLVGLTIRARAGDSPASLRDTATFAIDSLT